MKRFGVLSILAVVLLRSSSAQDLHSEPANDFFCPEDDPNGVFPHEEFCDKFYVCKAGLADLFTCEDGLAFDKTRRFHASKCDEFPNIKCGNRTKLQEATATEGCPRANGRFSHPDPTECGSFVVCKQGKYVVKACSSGLHFAPLSGQCTWPALAKRAGCQKKKKQAPDGWTCPDQNEEERDPSVGPSDPNPTYAHPTDCGKFYICIGGTDPRPNACPFGTVFDTKSKKCVEPKVVKDDCKYWYDEDPGAPKQRLSENPEPVTTEKPFTCPPDALTLSNGKEHSMFPHPTDCTKFYLCLNHVTPRLNTCSAQLVYNIKDEFCDEPKNVPDCADWFN